MIRSPMLASDYDEASLTFPIYASPKLDGIRAHVVDGVLMSRSGKPIRNAYVQGILGREVLNGLDGELVVGPMSDPNVYQATSSGIMSMAGEPIFTFCVFDDWTNPHDVYTDRMERFARRVDEFSYHQPYEVADRLLCLPQVFLTDLAGLEAYEAAMLQEGFEGVMVRGCDSYYKFGRSTTKEGLLLKVKRYEHDEAIVIGFDEMMHNDNEAFQNELGRTKRSSAKDGKRASGMLGAYIVRSPKYANEFNVSCGSMSHNERAERWYKREADMGRIVRFKYLPHGMKDVPRHPLFAGFRDADDL